MILQDEPFRFFTFWDAIESGLYFVIVGYYFLLFAYFVFLRFRVSKRLYWVFFGLIFLFLAIGQGFFIGYYFFIPELQGSMSNQQIGSTLMLCYRLATFFSWLAVACLMGVLGILLFPPETNIDKKITKNENRILPLTSQMKLLLRLLMIGLPILVGILALTLPDNLFMDPDIIEKYHLKITLITIFGYPVGRFMLNFILAPLLIAAIPILFIYLAIKTFGVLRRSYAMNAMGFFLYYTGRILEGVFEFLNWPHLEATLAPLIILLSLLIIYIANNYEQLK